METLLKIMKLLQIRIKKLMAKIYNDQDHDNVDNDYHIINYYKKIININNENKYEDD